MRQGLLAGRYPAVAAMVIFALVPFLGLSAALQPLSPIIGEQLYMSRQALALTTGMANAGYAIGTILAAQFALQAGGPDRALSALAWDAAASRRAAHSFPSSQVAALRTRRRIPGWDRARTSA